MSASAHTRPHRPVAQTRLRWWIVVLPAVAFVLLFALLGSGEAHAAGSLPLSQLLQWLQEAVLSKLG